MPETANQKVIGDVGFGIILTDLIESDTITDIQTRGNEIWVTDIYKGLHRVELNEYSDMAKEELNTLIDKIPHQIAMQMDSSFNEGSPMLDGEWIYKNKARLRFNAIHYAFTSDKKNAIALRVTPLGLRVNEETIFKDNYATEESINLLAALIASGCNVFIMGLTGAGKTELLRYISRFIKNTEAIITMEDTLEADLKGLYPEKDVLALKSSDRISYSDLLRSCLRQNPDWIIVSETRGQEIVDLLESVSTGHKIITTVHGDSAMNLPNRIIDMAKVDGSEANRMYKQVHTNIDIAIYIHYYNDESGSHRQIAEIAEFYLDKNGKPASHMIMQKDYVHNSYIYEPIKSFKIMNKIARGRTDIEKLKGVFISE